MGEHTNEGTAFAYACRCCWDRSGLYSLALCPGGKLHVCEECGETCENVGCDHVKGRPSPIQALNAIFDFVLGAPATQVRWRVDDFDGQYGTRLSPNGPVEVWLTGYEYAVDPERQAGRQLMYANSRRYREATATFFRLEFDTYVQAQAAGEWLAAAFKYAANAATLFPADADACDEFGHVVRLERFTRSLNMRAVCERCMAVLKDDVDPLEYLAIEEASGVTVAKLIEREVNA